MGESRSWLFEPTFNRSVKVASRDERITTDGGAILLREAARPVTQVLTCKRVSVSVGGYAVRHGLASEITTGSAEIGFDVGSCAATGSGKMCRLRSNASSTLASPSGSRSMRRRSRSSFQANHAIAP